MTEVIFSKFSNERAEAFQIRTDILIDSQGKRIVRKSALCEAARAHISKIYDWYVKLQPGYENAELSVNRCSLSEDGSYVDLEYLEGTTFQDYLDTLYEEGRFEELIEQICFFADRIKKTGVQEKFIMSPAFQKVFGTPELVGTKFASSLNNIDLIFPNIIMNTTWNIIDYEWTFDFQIPVDFIIYRAIHYYLMSSKRSKLKYMGVYEAVGITQADINVYEEMEHCFQLYILGDTFGLANLYPLIAKEAYDLEHTVKGEEKFQEESKIQIYLDEGRDFIEAESFWVSPVVGKEHIYEFPITDKTLRIRIDPANTPGILRFKEAYLIGNRVRDLEFKTNGELMTVDNYAYSTEDPFITFAGFERQKGMFHIEFVYERVELGVLNSVYHLIEKRKEQERLKLAYEDMAPQYQNALREATEYRKLVGSVFWKVSKPLRVSIDGVKNFFHHHYWMVASLKNGKKILSCHGVKGMREANRREWELRKNMHVLNEISLVYDLRDMEAQKAEAANTPQDIKFSIVVPLYNTPELYLRKMIESVLSQTYGNFELCLADGSDRKHRYVGDICKEYRWHDKRVVYQKLKKNMGIADNTNACLAMTSGAYIALFDHDDFLHPSALFRNYQAIKEKQADFIYSDENTFHETIDDAFNPHYKPDFSPDYLRSVNYICHLTVFSRKLYETVGGFRKEFDGSQDYDMILRLTEKAEHIVHIPQVLYYWRAHENSTAADIHAKDYCMVSAKKALAEHLSRVGLSGEVEDASILSWYRIKYPVKGEPLISIIIPNKDHVDYLDRCIQSIENVSTYKNYEIIVVENNSKLNTTFRYYEKLKENKKVQVVTWEKGFNFSAINNYGASFAKGEYLLLLNNDMEVLSPDWLQEMLMFAQRDDVGAVGAKLYYPDDTIQHAGVILGIGGVAGHSHKYYKRNEPGYFGRLVVAQDLSAVTAACVLMKRTVYDQVGGLDEKYQVAFNDVDLCMKIREAGYLIVYTPYAELYHYESVSRGSENTPEKVARFNGEVDCFMKKWHKELEAGDPYYNPNLSLQLEDFSEAIK